MLEKVSLFNTRKDFLLFSSLLALLSFITLSFEYYNYNKFIKFDSALVNATVIKQYAKTKLTKTGKTKSYQVLKLKSEDGFSFYTTTSKKTKNIQGKKLQLELFAGDINFYEYLSGFYGFSKILHVQKLPSIKDKLNNFISQQHANPKNTSIYQALFTATSMDYTMQTIFSNLGISHLIAISGFHLGVLSSLLYLLIRFPYKFLQNRYFPYRNYKRDSFMFISLTLFSYLHFLDYPPSLIRAFCMLVIGFFLYSRGVKIVSMQTLSVSMLFLLALLPRLTFSIGFWLSVSGVFYIFLFMIHFKHLSKLMQFVLLPIWVYLAMLPFSLSIFGNFSLYHPLSIIWTSLFTLFYPLSMFLHLIDAGGSLDFLLDFLVNLETNSLKIRLSQTWLILEIILSILAIYKKEFLYILILYNISMFIYAIDYIT